VCMVECSVKEINDHKHNHTQGSVAALGIKWFKFLYSKEYQVIVYCVWSLGDNNNIMYLLFVIIMYCDYYYYYDYYYCNYLLFSFVRHACKVL